MLAIKLWPLIGIILWHFTSNTDGRYKGQMVSSPHWLSIEANTYNHLTTDNRAKNIDLTVKNLNSSILFGKQLVNGIQMLENNIQHGPVEIIQGTPEHGQSIESRTDTDALQYATHVNIATRASLHLINLYCSRYGISSSDCAQFISKYDMKNTPLNEMCDVIKSKTCSKSVYRSYDGSCNNENNSEYGKAFSAYKRLLPPNYWDGIQEPRRSVTKHELPNARKISTMLSKGNSDRYQDSKRTLAFMQWGQFIEHDLAHTGFRRMISNNQQIQCCGKDGFVLSPRYRHPDCMQIDTSKDSVYSKKFVYCMNYVRSLPALRPKCTFGHIEQMNQATHFLDGSHIYGTNANVAKSLRTMKGGLLKTYLSFHELEYPPLSDNPLEDCQISNNYTHLVCFRAGDSRINAHPQLTVLYTLFIREHNRIARQLAQLNPKWNDEKLYQEARRIVIAEIQHITYDLWKPLLLVERSLAEYHLTDDINQYSSDVDPRITNSFATAAIRFLNTLMHGKISLVKDGKTLEQLPLRNYFNEPVLITMRHMLDSILNGLTSKQSNKLDFEYSPEITDHFLTGKSFGYDILALDIQRSRDHGLPSYNDYRELCGLSNVKEFSKLSDTITTENIALLQSVYAHPDDIDLLIGLLAEKPTDNGFIGPTLSCILDEQFKRTRIGDRYFYTNRNQIGSFTDSQLAELKKVSLARIICDNSDNIKEIQPDVFKKITSINKLVKCNDYDSIPKLNLKMWQYD